jgi:hypothetical protein
MSISAVEFLILVSFQGLCGLWYNLKKIEKNFTHEVHQVAQNLDL